MESLNKLTRDIVSEWLNVGETYVIRKNETAGYSTCILSEKEAEKYSINKLWAPVPTRESK